MKKASIMREKCCGMVLHGGRPDPVEVVDALTELEAERDAAHAAGRKDALEEAIEACEYRSSLLEEMDDHDGDAAAMLCAADIRAIQHQKGDINND